VSGVNIIKTLKLAVKHRELLDRYSDKEPLLVVLRDGVVINAIHVGAAAWIEAVNEQLGWCHDQPLAIGKRFHSESLGQKAQLAYPRGRVSPQLAGIWRLISPDIRLSRMYPELEFDDGGDGYSKVIPSYPQAVEGVFKCPRGEKCITNLLTEPLVQTFFRVDHREGGRTWMECGFCQHVYPAEKVVAYTFGRK
jgi:aspartate carbamoyltransferase regulatory subunit